MSSHHLFSIWLFSTDVLKFVPLSRFNGPVYEVRGKASSNVCLFSTGAHYTGGGAFWNPSLYLSQFTFGTTSTKVSFRKTKMGKQNDNVSMEWWGGRIRKLTVRPPHLWQQRFEDRPMTIFHSLSIFWTVIFGGFPNKHCFDLF